MGDLGEILNFTPRSGNIGFLFYLGVSWAQCAALCWQAELIKLQKLFHLPGRLLRKSYAPCHIKRGSANCKLLASYDLITTLLLCRPGTKVSPYHGTTAAVFVNMIPIARSSGIFPLATIHFLFWCLRADKLSKIRSPWSDSYKYTWLLWEFTDLHHKWTIKTKG